MSREEIAKIIKAYLASLEEGKWISYDYALFEALRQFPGGFP